MTAEYQEDECQRTSPNQRTGHGIRHDVAERPRGLPHHVNHQESQRHGRAPHDDPPRQQVAKRALDDHPDFQNVVDGHGVRSGERQDEKWGVDEHAPPPLPPRRFHQSGERRHEPLGEDLNDDRQHAECQEE